MSDPISTLTNGLNLDETQLAILTANYKSLATQDDDDTDALIVTQAGFDLLSNILAGNKTLNFVRVAFGDSEINGSVVPVSDSEAYALTNLIHWRKDLPLVDIVNFGTGEVNLKFLVANADVSEGFWMRELGVFAQDPDTEQEILYAYRNITTKVGWLPPAGGAEVWEHMMIVTIAVGQAKNITAVTDPGLYLTREEFQTHLDSTDPHPLLLNVSKKDFLTAVF